MVTLSRVMTGWGGKSATCSFRLTFLATRSKKGILMCRPERPGLGVAAQPLHDVDHRLRHDDDVGDDHQQKDDDEGKDDNRIRP